eukprot:5815733-Prymnesium_polylepis.1
MRRACAHPQGFSRLIRANKIVGYPEEGFESFAGGVGVTIVSAPNCEGEMDNGGAVIDVDEGLACTVLLYREQAGVWVAEGAMSL